MNPIEKILKDYPLMVLDGAFATQLEQKGCDLNDPLWSAKILIENPGLIQEVHRDYFEAGADCVITASYQATFEGFMKRGLSEEEAGRLIALSVELAIEERDRFWAVAANREGRPKPLVAASVGPYGAYLADGSEYRGDYNLTIKELADFHRKRMATLIEAGPDILACETIPCLDEAMAVVDVLETHRGVYGWISFSARDGVHINSGEKIRDCAQWLDGHDQVAAIGVNCTAPEHIESLVGEIRKESGKPIILYPNSGEEYDVAEKAWHGSPVTTVGSVSAGIWHDKGAGIIGGCCRTTPSQIREIASWAHKLIK